MGHGASGAQHSGKSARTRRIAPSSLKERFASAFSHNLQRKRKSRFPAVVLQSARLSMSGPSPTSTVEKVESFLAPVRARLQTVSNGAEGLTRIWSAPLRVDR